MSNKNAGNIKYKKICTSINPKLLEALDNYAAEHYIPRAAAMHLLLMEGMEMDVNEVNFNIALDGELVQFGGNLPEEVLANLNDYTEKHGFNKKQRYIPFGALLITTLTKKGYWKGEC